MSIPDLAALELQQTYEPIGGEMTLRTIGGSAIKQITWQKWRTTITGGGWLPFGLSSLDYSAQMAVACIVPRGVVCSGCPRRCRRRGAAIRDMFLGALR